MDFLLKIPKIKNKNQVKCPKAGHKQDKNDLGRTNGSKQDWAGQIAQSRISCPGQDKWQLCFLKKIEDDIEQPLIMYHGKRAHGFPSAQSSLQLFLPSLLYRGIPEILVPSSFGGVKLKFLL